MVLIDFKQKVNTYTVGVTSGATPCLKKEPLTSYLDFMGKSVAAVIRLMTQTRQTSVVLWKRPLLPPRQEEAQREDTSTENLIYTQSAPPL